MSFYMCTCHLRSSLWAYHILKFTILYVHRISITYVYYRERERNKKSLDLCYRCYLLILHCTQRNKTCFPNEPYQQSIQCRNEQGQLHFLVDRYHRVCHCSHIHEGAIFHRSVSQAIHEPLLSCSKGRWAGGMSFPKFRWLQLLCQLCQLCQLSSKLLSPVFKSSQTRCCKSTKGALSTRRSKCSMVFFT